mmetsp:Transcript_16753/g.37082  ORF Transcript_16753/g.37082 Transcript_16753/m.37082 type:complete len:223 (+) Transcript_16753:363-1031(+)
MCLGFASCASRADRITGGDTTSSSKTKFARSPSLTETTRETLPSTWSGGGRRRGPLSGSQAVTLCSDSRVVNFGAGVGVSRARVYTSPTWPFALDTSLRKFEPVTGDMCTASLVNRSRGGEYEGLGEADRSDAQVDSDLGDSSFVFPAAADPGRWSTSNKLLSSSKFPAYFPSFSVIINGGWWPRKPTASILFCSSANWAPKLAKSSRVSTVSIAVLLTNKN